MQAVNTKLNVSRRRPETIRVSPLAFQVLRGISLVEEVTCLGVQEIVGRNLQ